MSEFAVTAPPMSWVQIESKAWALRENFGLHEKPFFPVMAFVETVLVDELEAFELRVWEDHKCNGAEGFTCPKGDHITLPESVYAGAYDNNPRDRFTVAHELGHYILHAGRPLLRMTTQRGVKPFRDPEMQANRFAAALLMPWQLFPKLPTVGTVQDRFGVSASAARHRIAEWRKK